MVRNFFTFLMFLVMFFRSLNYGPWCSNEHHQFEYSALPGIFKQLFTPFRFFRDM